MERGLYNIRSQSIGKTCWALYYSPGCSGVGWPSNKMPTKQRELNKKRTQFRFLYSIFLSLTALQGPQNSLGPKKKEPGLKKRKNGKNKKEHRDETDAWNC